MAGITILPPQPQTGFGPVLAALIQGGLQGYEEHKNNQKMENAIQRFTQANSPLEALHSLSTLKPEQQKMFLEYSKLQQKQQGNQALAQLLSGGFDTGFDNQSYNQPIEAMQSDFPSQSFLSQNTQLETQPAFNELLSEAETTPPPNITRQIPNMVKQLQNQNVAQNISQQEMPQARQTSNVSPRGIRIKGRLIPPEVLATQSPQVQMQLMNQAQKEEELELRKIKDLREERKLNRAEFQNERAYNTAKAEPFIKKVDSEREALPFMNANINAMESGLEDVAGLSRDYFANLFNSPQLKTASGAAFSSGIKDYLIGDISKITGQKNQWIEKQMSSALPQVGNSKEANQSLIEGLKFKRDIIQKRADITADLQKHYMETLGYEPGDLSRIVDEASKPYIKQREEKLAYDLRKIKEQDKGMKWMSAQIGKKVVKGTPLTLEMGNLFLRKFGTYEKAAKAAKELGYVIPDEDVIDGNIK